MTSLIALGLILIILATLGIIPLLAGVIIGSLALFVALVMGILIGVRKTRPLIVFSMVPQASEWCDKELARREALPDNERQRVLGNEFFHKSNDLPHRNTILDRIVEQHPSAFRLAAEGQSLSRTSSVGAVIGCYVILMESLKQVKNIFQKEGGSPPFGLSENQSTYFRQAYQRACTLPSPENYLLLINEQERRADFFLGITAGVSWMWRSYMVLRSRVTEVSNIVPVPESEFYTPGTDVYFCRQLFNSVREALLQVFPLNIIEKEFAKAQKGTYYHSFLEDLRDICLVADTESSSFLRHHPSYPYKNRAALMNFCN